MQTGTYWGMHMFWWIVWIVLIAYIFFTPRGPKRSSKKILLRTLRKTYAEGKISTQEYEERKKVLLSEFESVKTTQVAETLKKGNV